jgi:hypothetical protein
MPVQQPNYLELLPLSGPLRLSTNKTTSTPVFFSLQTKLRMSLQGCIVYLLLMYGAHTLEARCSDLAYLLLKIRLLCYLGASELM